jgi:hypothetical protein
MTIHRFDPAPPPESDEQLVREVIGTAMSDTRPPANVLAAALARGRRLRARRRVAIGSGALAAGVLVGVAGPWLLSGGTESGQVAHDGAVAAETPTPRPPTSLSPTPGPAPAGYWDMPAVDMVVALEAILPEAGPASGYVHSTLASTFGKGDTNVMMSPDPGVGEAARISCPGNLVSPVSCTELVDQDGTHVGRRSTSRTGDVTTFEVVLTVGDGVVYAATANTVDRKWGANSPLTAPRPLLTMDQLMGLARNEVWTSYRS